MLLSIVFDLAEKLPLFASKDASLSEIVFDYYVSFILFHGNMFSSMIIFIAVIWFTAKWRRIRRLFLFGTAVDRLQDSFGPI